MIDSYVNQFLKFNETEGDTITFEVVGGKCVMTCTKEVPMEFYAKLTLALETRKQQILAADPVAEKAVALAKVEAQQASLTVDEVVTK